MFHLTWVVMFLGLGDVKVGKGILVITLMRRGIKNGDFYYIFFDFVIGGFGCVEKL